MPLIIARCQLKSSFEPMCEMLKEVRAVSVAEVVALNVAIGREGSNELRRDAPKSTLGFVDPDAMVRKHRLCVRISRRSRWRARPCPAHRQQDQNAGDLPTRRNEGWDHVCAFHAGNRAFVALANANGNLRIVRLQANGRPDAVVSNPAGVFGLSRLSAIASYSIGASTCMFTVGDGQSVYRMNNDGSLGSRLWHEATPLTQISVATSVAHLRVGTAHSLFLIDAVGGLHIRRITADGTIGGKPVPREHRKNGPTVDRNL